MSIMLFMVAHDTQLQMYEEFGDWAIHELAHYMDWWLLVCCG